MRAQPLIGRGMSPPRAAWAERAPRAEKIVIPAISPDGSLFPIDKMEAHRQGTLHLAVSVFIMCGDHLLLQRRAMTKYHCGGLWANTCCSHPDWGEAPAAGARRRLREELGLSLPLHACNVIDYVADVTDGLRECERVHVYRGNVDSMAVPLNPDPAEVCAVRWMNLSALRDDARRQPARYAPWFRIYLARWDELGL
jgi:isopentenyl-diphosphate Delta-isomerase